MSPGRFSRRTIAQPKERHMMLAANLELRYGNRELVVAFGR